MEVNDSWCDREAPERIDQNKLVAIDPVTIDAGQMEQPVVMESRKSIEARDRENNRSPGKQDNRPDPAPVSSATDQFFNSF